MIIEDRRNIYKVDIFNMQVGTVFEYSGNFFMKVDSHVTEMEDSDGCNDEREFDMPHNCIAVSLKSGSAYIFSGVSNITEVKAAKLIIEK
jgi:hypothetical protein